ncbi:hypothetical protein [Epilithonimonas caeni]|uniref:hypothetical protein n=1 Tax=Epilithonimonas caeni TaxID=365343 RepID=UPI00040C76D7|nr:hypothetical protein [Epilithonimonas caeni]
MKCFFLKNTLDNRIKGQYPQIKDVRYYCHIWDTPNFMGNIHFKKFPDDVILATPILDKKSNLTDLIEIWHVGFNLNLLLSGKLKNIIEKYIDKSKGEFISCPIIKEGIEYLDYWIFNGYGFNQEFIDFQNSLIKYEKHTDDFETTYETKMVFLSVENLKEFEKYIKVAQEKTELITIEKLILKENITPDFVMLRYVFSGLYLVSEKLKTEIESAGCTGIEFQPSHLSLNEWLHSEREKVYGKI